MSLGSEQERLHKKELVGRWDQIIEMGSDNLHEAKKYNILTTGKYQIFILT